MENVVRIATREDQDEVMQLLHMLHAEGGLMPFSEQRAAEMFDRAYNRQGGILGVLGERGDIRGMIFLLISRFWYTDQNHLEELFNFVRPDLRENGKHYAQSMIEFAKKCSDEIGIPLVIGVLTNTRMAGKVRFYRRFLGYPTGAFFVHNAKWQQAEANEDFWRPAFPRIRTGDLKKGKGGYERRSITRQ
jgi:hypothetical protein